jgi:hypothetical protein
MLKKILIALAVIVVVFVAVVALQPSEFRVERTATISALAPDVFEQVNNFHNWEAWSPWAKLDPAAKVSFEGPSSAGAVFKWVGNDKVGEGKMTLTESRPNDLVKIKVDFVKPFAGSNDSALPEGDQTAVTWTVSGSSELRREGVLLRDERKKMIADTMDQGLANMKSVVESASR